MSTSIVTRLILPALLAMAGPTAAAQAVHPYRAIDLGMPPTQTPPAGVGAAAMSSDHRHVGGTSVWEPYVWTAAAGMRSLGKLPGKLNAEVFDVDRFGNAVGSCGWEATSNQLVATVWDAAGNPTALGGLGGPFSRARAMNDSGLVIGNATILSGSSYVWHAFTWTAAGGTVDLTPTATASVAHDLNEAGQILLDVDGAAFRYSPSTGLESFGNVSLSRLNEVGQILGRDANGVSARYTDGLGWESFGGAGGIELREHGDLNDLGQIVGTQWIRTGISPPSYTRHGYLYTFGLGFQRLDEWIDPAQQVTVWSVVAISDDGFIACEGSIGPDNRAMLLEPRFTHPYGNGCAGSNGAPKIAATGVPHAGERLALLGGGGRGSTGGAFFLSTNPAALTLPDGCTLLVDFAGALVLPAPTNAAGQAIRALQLPAGTPAIALYAQFASVDAGATNGLFALSGGLRIDLQ